MTKPNFIAMYPLVEAALAGSNDKWITNDITRFFTKAVPAIRAAIEAGEIDRVSNKDVRGWINDFVSAAFKLVISENYTYSGKWEKLPSDLRYLDFPSEARLIGSFEKKLAKITSKGHQMYRDAVAVTVELKELQGIVEWLNSVEFSRVKRNAEVKERKAQELRIAQDTDAVYQAVLPLKTAAEDRAEQLTRAAIKNWSTKLEEVGGHVNVIAPRPHAKQSKGEYRAAAALRQFIFSFTANVSYKGDDEVRKVSEEDVERVVQDARRDAAAQFEAYVAKLNAKINDISIKAELAGDPWFGSTLTVQTQNKGTQVWTTKVIVNCSVYGKLFNQWPTRLKA